MKKDAQNPEQSKKKIKNELRTTYDNFKKSYSGITSTWRKTFMNDSEYQSFMKAHSYAPSDEVPLKYHKKIDILKEMIDNQIRLVKELEGKRAKS